MAKKYIALFILFHPFVFLSQNVGINNSDPQQKLHLGGTDSNIRIDAFNSTNNPKNTSSSVTAPLYVDHNGVLTLDFQPFNISDGNFDFDPNLTSAIIVEDKEQADIVESIIFTIPNVYVSRPSYIQVNYSISYLITDMRDELITDNLARVIQNFITVTDVGTGTGENNVYYSDGSEELRKYGMSAQCYINGESEAGILESDGAFRTYYNSGSAYIYIAQEGTYSINFNGGVGSGSEGATTKVHFGIDQDMLLIRFF